MSRLLDRVLASCMQFRPSILYDEAGLREQLRQLAAQETGDEATRFARARERWLKIEPVSKKKAPLTKCRSLSLLRMT